MKKEITIEILLTKLRQTIEEIKDDKLRDEVVKFSNMAYELGKKDAQKKGTK